MNHANLKRLMAEIEASKDYDHSSPLHCAMSMASQMAQDEGGSSDSEYPGAAPWLGITEKQVQAIAFPTLYGGRGLGLPLPEKDEVLRMLKWLGETLEVQW